MDWIEHDGGRKDAGFKGQANDCACRSIAIATGKSYKDIYDLINAFGKKERRKKKSSARTGVYKATMDKIMEHLGWAWVPCMSVGTGVQVHMTKDELPSGRLVVRLSRHYSAIIDGVCYDTHNPTREGKRAVYGYWKQP